MLVIILYDVYLLSCLVFHHCLMQRSSLVKNLKSGFIGLLGLLLNFILLVLYVYGCIYVDMNNDTNTHKTFVLGYCRRHWNITCL